MSPTLLPEFIPRRVDTFSWPGLEIANITTMQELLPDLHTLLVAVQETCVYTGRFGIELTYLMN